MGWRRVGTLGTFPTLAPVRCSEFVFEAGSVILASEYLKNRQPIAGENCNVFRGVLHGEGMDDGETHTSHAMDVR